MHMSPYYLTQTGLARVKSEALLQGMRLRRMRAEREAKQALDRAALPALPEFRL